MFQLITRKSTRPRTAFLDLTQLTNLIVRWLPFAARRSAAGTSLQHLGSLPLTAQSSVALVRVYNETLVLGITSQSVTLLTKAAGHDFNKLPSCADRLAPDQEKRGTISGATVS
jgi:flagellar biogenesis protein FliO